MPSIAFHTFGCPKNEVDSNRMRTILESAGYDIVEDQSTADVVVINTCAFLTEAIEENVDAIFEILEDEGFIKNDAKLVVTGCMPSRFGEELSESLPEVAAFLPCAQEDTIAEVVAQLCDVEPATVDLSKPLRNVEGNFSAYVKISDGCNRFCSFCAIPFIRGRYHSRDLESILVECKELVEAGIKELILIGQDTGIWGTDFEEKQTLSQLVDAVASAFPETWVRVMYLQPEGLTDELIDTFVRHENVCRYLDIPLQHSDPDVLHEMNRKGSAEEYIEVVNKVRAKLPDIRIRTTLIAGFPGETRAQSSAVKRFIEDAEFDYAGVFVYSQEDGTRAGKRSDQVPMRTRKARAQRMRDIADSIGFARATALIGTECQVLVEGYEENDGITELVGRSMGQAPEIDGMVHLPLGSAELGEIVRVKLIDSFCYEFEGEVI